MEMPDIMELLKSSGCLSFVEAKGAAALAQIKERRPKAWEYLSAEAEECLRENFRERYALICRQVLKEEIRIRLEQYDPVGWMLGRFRPEPVNQAAQDLLAEADGRIDEYLYAGYPLIKGYEERICGNYVNCFSDFLGAFLDRKDEISERLLGGRQIRAITHLSTGGADIHRNGRCVIGVTTDAGTVYYKPHDCSLDVLYHEIVGNWFADCTVAADVVPGKAAPGPDGSGGDYAFVACLNHEPVRCKEDIPKYFYHFGILTALLHGLGSMDMHYENIISCADRPAVADLETLLAAASETAQDKNEQQTIKAQQELADSLLRTCLLPLRLYKGPLISPMYSNGDHGACLPEYDGQVHAMPGHEEEFLRGFHEGYARMLAHRPQILAMLERYKDATVRCLLRNTRFYYLIREHLFRPEYLRDEAAREAVYGKLCAPFSLRDREPDPETTRYEWACMIKGDIPYYCTTVGGRDLCGEDPGQVVKKDLYQTRVQDAVSRFLARLCPEEETFEMDMLRVAFDHAPTDEEKDPTGEPVSAEAADAEPLSEELCAIFEGLKKDAVHSTDGTPLWFSTVQTSEALTSFSDASMYGDAGRLAAEIILSGRFPQLHEEARELIKTVLARIDASVAWIDRQLSENSPLPDEKKSLYLPTGLYAGAGGVLLACRQMALAQIPDASDVMERVLRLILQEEIYRYKKTDLAEGAAGLVLALSAPDLSENGKKCLRAAAERLLEEDLPERPDLPYGCAGIGAALAAAYECLADPRYRQGALEAFRKVKDDYKADLAGWPNGSAPLRFLANKGPHAAGIYMAAAYAKSRLDDPLPEEVCALALSCMTGEDTLLHNDTLDQGNALTVLAMLAAGRLEDAGRILSAMLARKGRKGSYAIMPPGVRSAYDPSFYMGTPGVGYAMMKYLAAEQTQERRDR